MKIEFTKEVVDGLVQQFGKESAKKELLEVCEVVINELLTEVKEKEETNELT